MMMALWSMSILVVGGELLSAGTNNDWIRTNMIPLCLSSGHFAFRMRELSKLRELWCILLASTPRNLVVRERPRA